MSACDYKYVKSYWILQHIASFFFFSLFFFYRAYVYKMLALHLLKPIQTLSLLHIDSILSMHTRKALLIALSHPLTINDRPGSRTRASGREEGGFEWNAQEQRWMVGEENNNIQSSVVVGFFFLPPLEVVKGQRRGVT